MVVSDDEYETNEYGWIQFSLNRILVWNAEDSGAGDYWKGFRNVWLRL